LWYNWFNQIILGDKTMADNNTLDDLILSDPEQKKPKGLLALLALIVLLIIVGAILAKMIFSSSDSIQSESNKTHEKSVKTITDTNGGNNASSNLDLQDPDLAPLNEINDTADTSVEIEGGVVDETQTKEKGRKKSTQKEQSKQEEQLKNDTDEIMLQEVKTKKSESNKVAHSEAKPKPMPKPAPQHPRKVYGGHGTVYIQVGSFVKGPESSFIEKIRRAGFKFRIKEINGKRRVYVGPFRSREEAKSLLGVVRSKINPQAFIK